ncbi:MAG TPA: hypothetical protein VKA43_08945 [Gammaproteobacteria bacterium]|nr:hypothetical protein [Gammaproteobacteria bacterium]
MTRQKQSTERRRLLRALVVVCILIAAGPEIGIALELIGLLDLVGVELFFALVFGGLLLRVRAILSGLEQFFGRLDPFFFIPTRQQVANYPGILVHAVPGLVSICIAGYLVSEISLPQGMT